MSSKTIQLGIAVVLLGAGAARAEEPQPTMTSQHEAIHAAMHDAMQTQMASPTTMPEMPEMADRVAGAAAHQRSMQMQEARDVAQKHAMTHAGDAAKMHDGAAMGAGMQGGTGHCGTGMGGDATTQGAGMMRTGDMHGGTGGMMSGSGTGGGMMDGSGTGGGMMH